MSSTSGKETVSNSASASNAWNEICNSSYSVLSHRFGLPLAILFKFFGDDLRDAEDSSEFTDTFKASKRTEFVSNTSWNQILEYDYIKQLNMDQTINNVLQHYVALATELEAPCNTWFARRDLHETKLTSATYEAISAYLKDVHKFPPPADGSVINCGEAQEVLHDGFAHDAYYDLVIQKEVNEQIHPLALFELGQTAGNLLKKHDQAMAYLAIIAKNAHEGKITGRLYDDKPVLVCTLFLNRSTKLYSISVFLCWKRADRFALALLWRTEVSTSKKVAKAIALVSTLSLTLDKWVSNAELSTSPRYVKLGPNCCKVEISAGTYSVLRCYDTRLRNTDRKPDVYLNWSRAGTTDQSCIGKQVVKLLDNNTGSNILKFGDRMPKIDVEGSNMRERDWMWQFCGQLLILSTGYFEGSHAARSAANFLRIIEDLQDLHKAGFVHADIRCFNIVFHDVWGRLIDFDMGGPPCGVLYPRGYVTGLRDGTRVGLPGQEVEQWHDWQSLWDCIFSLHGFNPERQKRSDLDRVLIDELLELQGMEISSDPDVAEKVPRLVKFLEDIQGAKWTCTPRPKLTAMIRACEQGTVDGATVVSDGSHPVWVKLLRSNIVGKSDMILESRMHAPAH